MKITEIFNFTGNSTNSTDSIYSNLAGYFEQAAPWLGIGLAGSALLNNVKKLVNAYENCKLADLYQEFKLPRLDTLVAATLTGFALAYSGTASGETAVGVSLIMVTLMSFTQQSVILLKPSRDPIIESERKRKRQQSKKFTEGVRTTYLLPQKTQASNSVQTIDESSSDNLEINQQIKRLTKISFTLTILSGGAAWPLARYLLQTDPYQASIIALIATNTVNIAANSIFGCVVKCKPPALIEDNYGSSDSRSSLLENS